MLTPNYDHEKVANPSLTDLIDVFDDAWKGYILEPAQVLLNSPSGDIAAMSLLCPYFESIEALYQGESSRGKSRKFFIAGFQRVFQKTLGLAGNRDTEIAAEAIYKNVRNGVAHTGFPTGMIHIQRKNPNAFLLICPQLPDGQLDLASVCSIMVNPQRIHDSVKWHLDQYVNTLRQEHEITLRDNFDRLMRSEWGVGKDDNVVGLTAEIFEMLRSPR